MLNFLDSIKSIKSKIENIENNSNQNYPNLGKVKEKGINGIIDETVYQGNYEDCWLISGVLAMSYTDAGADIIKDSIKARTDGSIDVTFPYACETYNIPQDEFEKNNLSINSKNYDYSVGDDDMLALELATEKLIQAQGITKYSIKDGGNPYYIFKMFNADFITVSKTPEEIICAFKEFERFPDKYAMTLGVLDNSICGLRENHGYTIKNVDENTVTLIDPWNTSKEITVDKNELLNSADSLSLVYAKF